MTADRHTLSTDSRLRVLVVPAERYPCDHSFLEEALAKNGEPLDVEFLMRTIGEVPPGTNRWCDARVHVFPRRSRILPIAWTAVYFMDLRYLYHLSRLVRTFRPSILYVRDLTFPLFLGILLRSVFHWRVVFQKSFPHELQWFDAKAQRGLLLPWLFRAGRRLEWPIRNWLMRRADAVIPISRTMGDELVEAGVCLPDRVHPFGMGIGEDIAAMETSGLRGESEPLRLLYVGTLSQTRGVAQLLEAFRIAVEKHGLDLRLSLVGGTAAEIQQTRDSLRCSPVADRVRIWGRVPRSELSSVLSQHDAAAIYIPADPRYWVASVTKLIEAAGAGLPCVATDSVAMHRQLAERTGSIVITDDSPEGFAAGLLTLVGHWQEYAHRAQEARPAMVEEYSYVKTRKRMARLLHSLVGEEAQVTENAPLD